MRPSVPVLILACLCAARPVVTTAIESPSVPAALQASGDQVPRIEAVGTGVQIYECKPAKNDPSRYEWTFKAPEATLADAAGHTLGRHYAGPSWESTDGSVVVGEVKAKDDGPDPAAIPWLLLTAKSTSGSGAFARVTSIQRIKTSGGKAPATGCDTKTANETTRVPYSATYVFYVAAP